MTYRHDGYHSDGSLCVYGYDEHGSKIMIFRGYLNTRNDTVTLYPKVLLARTNKDIKKTILSLRLLK